MRSARFGACRALAARAVLATELALATPAFAGPPVLTVTTNADGAVGSCDADCSLREAIVAANAEPGPNAVHFAIPSDGAPVAIALTSALPAITSPLEIRGETQPGASCQDLALRIELDGSSAGAGAVGLRIEAPDSTVRGLAIHSFGDSGIEVAADGATIACNRIGADALGTGGSGNEGAGVLIDGAAGALVGGDAPNSIRGNQGGGVWVFGPTALGNRISRNALAENGGIGIELLGAFFEDPIDPGDADEGPNRLQNGPAIASAVYDAGAGELTAALRVDSDPANAAYPIEVELFRSDDGDEGSAFLGSVVFTAEDHALGAPVSYAIAPLHALAAGAEIVATATDAEGNTSEFPALPTLVAPEADAVGAAFAAGLALAWRRRRAARLTSA